MDNFNIITEEDKLNMSYGACVGGHALIGMAVGRFVGIEGLLAGGIVGTAVGLLTCKRLQEPIKKKLFSSHAHLRDREIAAALQEIHQQRPELSKQDAIDLLASVRREISLNPKKYRKLRA